MRFTFAGKNGYSYRSETAQAVRGFTLPTGFYDYCHPIDGLRRSAFTLENHMGYEKLPTNVNHTQLCLPIRSIIE
jgi:hypothetical protein